jgi:hypothetical protein
VTVFRAEDLHARLRQQPYRPFRIHTSEGLQFDIRHPDLVFVGRHDLMVGFAAPDNPGIYDRVVRVALVHIVAIEELSPNVPSPLVN